MMFPSEGFVKEHYFELLKAVRRELESHRRGETKTESDSDSVLDTIRNDCPEITERIYSYLPLRDRICTLSLVDRAFSRDPIRGGIVCATYGRGFNLKHALLELEEHWSGSPADGVVVDNAYNFIATMKECTEEASNSERLLVTGSNVKNRSVDPNERKRWVRNHAKDFFGNETRTREIARDFGRSWLTEAILVQTLLKRYFFDGAVGRLQQLFQQFDCECLYTDYLSKQAHSKDSEKENGDWEWCLPDLSPGCHLWLPDIEDSNGKRRLCGGNWKRHEFSTCRSCRKLRENCVKVGCHHGHCSYFCKDCFRQFPEERWSEHIDPDSGLYFYYNAADGTTSWDRPQKRLTACVHCRKSQSRDYRGDLWWDEKSGQWITFDWTFGR